MGCSPSKGQLFAGVPTHKALQHGTQKNNPNASEIQSKIETDIVSDGLTILEDNLVPTEGKESFFCNVECDTTVIGKDVDVETNVDTQEELWVQDKVIKKDDRKKKNKGSKRSKKNERLRKAKHIQSKVDLPEEMVKAHQAAYAYLNPNIPKYESLLRLLDQATQTQISLQPMAALLALRYEEINQALEEMAVEGEQMLKEHGNSMAWPAALKDVQFNLTKPDSELYSPETSPDLLQQMLQHSTKKMRLVGDSVKVLGDTALEEAADYFASLSRLLGEKLVIKRATEGRLKEVLDHVEAAALKKFSLEDAALHSEDSGICADNECQNGSGRLRRHRESSGSGGSTGSSSGCPDDTLQARPHLNGVDEDRNDVDDDVEDDDSEDDSSEDEEEAKDEYEGNTAATGRKMSNCSGMPAHEGSLRTGGPKNHTLESTDQRGTKTKRPKTADNTTVQGNFRSLHRAKSADCLYQIQDEYFKKEQDESQKDNQKPVCLGKGLAGGLVSGSLSKTRLRRHSSEGHGTVRGYGLQYGSKGPFKETLPSSMPLEFVPAPPGRNAVKRLINTFSQGTNETANPKLLTGPVKVQGTKKGFLPMLNNSKGGVSNNGTNNNNGYSADQRFSERPEDVDVDSLPPPPPEVLMDNSFESSEGPTAENNTETLNHGCPIPRQRCGVSQRLRASLQTVTVLPSRANIRQRSQSISPARPTRQNAVFGGQRGQECNQQIRVNGTKEEAASLYQQSRKIIHLQHKPETPAKASRGPGIIRESSVARQGSKDTGDYEALTPYPNSYPPTTPPVSRARLPPSCPLVHHRIPSPPALPLTPACGQWVNPASSPNAQKWTRKNSEEENGSSLSFNDARSVFCQGTQSLTPSCRATLPRPWGEPSRGRLQTIRQPQTSGVGTMNIDQQHPLSSATQPQIQDNDRRVSVSVSEGEEPPACTEEAEQITDNQD